jgi:hypothetical protein
MTPRARAPGSGAPQPLYDLYAVTEPAPPPSTLKQVLKIILIVVLIVVGLVLLAAGLCFTALYVILGNGQHGFH